MNPSHGIETNLLKRKTLIGNAVTILVLISLLLVSVLPTVTLADNPVASGGDTAIGFESESQYLNSNHKPLTIVDLQPFKKTISFPITNSGSNIGRVTLINLNPFVNSWYLLKFEWTGDNTEQIFHLELIDTNSQELTLRADTPYQLIIKSTIGEQSCKLWSDKAASELVKAQQSRAIFVPLCNHNIYLRNRADGHKTTLEWGTDFVRDYLPAGERIATLVKELFFKDAYLETPEESIPADPKASEKPLDPAGTPARPRLNPIYQNIYLKPAGLGLELITEQVDHMLAGRWYQVKDQPGVFVSVLQPKMIAEELLAQNKILKPMDEVESNALVYMVAFDSEQFSLRFALGTEHPRVDWSDRVLDEVRDPTLTGPDGIDTTLPLIRTGKISPNSALSVTATFTGGFKRVHGAFHWGELALKNHGSHYGFWEEGVRFSQLQPGLSTVIVYRNGFVDVKTWQIADEETLTEIRYARQNGVPLVEFDEKKGQSKPGALVLYWGAGNWSGSAEGLLRSLRASLAIQENGGKRFICYGYFSTATPSAMARVFQAYQVKYAMLLDMNALEHTYLALYQQNRQQFNVQHLIKGMSVLDKNAQGIIVPRFIGYADNRDFFYLLRKTAR